MKKLLSLILCFVLCLSLFACNDEEAASAQETTEASGEKSTLINGETKKTTHYTNPYPSPTPTVPKPEDEKLPEYDEGIICSWGDYYCIDSYERFFFHLSDKANSQNSIIQDEKSKYSEEYERFVDELTAKEHIETPHVDGKRMSLRGRGHDIALFSSEYYDLPCVMYSCSSAWGNVQIAVFYPHTEEWKNFSGDTSISGIIIFLNTKYDKWVAQEHVYQKEIKLSDRTVTAFFDEFEERGETHIFVCYDSSLIIFRVKQSVYNNNFIDFFEHFSMQ